jgi:hypothetical protein
VLDYNIVDRCSINHEMSTKSRGSILPQGGRGSMIGAHGAEGVPGDPVGLEARNAFPLPDDCMTDAEGDPTLHSVYPPEGL